MAKARAWVVVAGVVVVCGVVMSRAVGGGSGGGGGGGTGSAAAASASAGARASAGAIASAAAKASGSASASVADTADAYAPERFAGLVRKYAAEAGVDPRLVMTILYNESYKPHDPSFERSWQKVDSNAAFGIANMHEATFDEVRQGRPFARASWFDLPGNPPLAIESEAWYLHDLDAALPSHIPSAYTRDELLAMGYNAGQGNMLAFARGVTPGSQAQSYLDTFRENWPKAGKALGE